MSFFNHAGRFATLADAYRQGLADIVGNGALVEGVTDRTSIGSMFGRQPRRTIELLGYSFEIANPEEALLNSAIRRVRLPFCVGGFLWTIAASSSVEWISYYNPRALDFSDDGIQFNASFGQRLFQTPNQFESIVRRLTTDPNSRRASCTVLSAEDNFRETRDYPCCLTIQFLIREGTLSCIVHMRSQSAFGVLPYDAFFFMSIQRWLASRLDLPCGSYVHLATSFHVYEDELNRVYATLRAPLTSITMGPMDDPEREMKLLLLFEERVRRIVRDKRVDELRAFNDLSGQKGFWKQSRAVLLIHAYSALHLDFDPLVAKFGGDSEICWVLQPDSRDADEFESSLRSIGC